MLLGVKRAESSRVVILGVPRAKAAQRRVEGTQTDPCYTPVKFYFSCGSLNRYLGFFHIFLLPKGKNDQDARNDEEASFEKQKQ